MPTCRPDVSVLLPVRDAASTLPACLDSLTRQTLPTIEIVIADDGSRDGSLELARAAARADQRIRVLAGERAGLAATLNRGLEACRSDRVARMDADDVCRLDRLERQAAALAADPALTLVSCRTASFPTRNLSDGFRRYEDWLNGLLTGEAIEANFFVESPFAHPSVMFRAGAVRAAGGYRDGDWPEDYDLWIRLRRAGARFAKLPQTLLAWRMHAQRASLTDPRYGRDAFRRLKLERLTPELPRRLAVMGAGRVGRWWIHRLQARGLEVAAALDVDPGKIGGRVGGAPVLALQDLPRVRDHFILVTVAKRGERERATAFLRGQGLADTRDFRCVA